MLSLPINQIQALARENQEAVVAFAQQLVCIPSLPGQEENVAALVRQKMETLGYDELQVDPAGNLVGKIAGGDGPAVILNGHMDHVDAGSAGGWPYPPFSGQLADGALWGRGALDMKGPVACMMYAGGLLKKLDFPLPGDLYMTVAVMEEIGGLGTEYLMTHLNAQAAICGEPSNNILRRGHRGRVELQVAFEGRSAHASLPHLGLNPHYGAAAFLNALPSLSLAQDDTLGGSTVVPTLFATDQISPNVIPGRVELTLDWRNVPHETPEAIVAKTKTLLEASLARLEPSARPKTNVSITAKEFTTYTGLVKEQSSIFPSFLLPEDNPLVQAAHGAVVEVLGRDEGVDIWRFATDGGHLMAAGIPTVGFGPGDETLAHTNQEKIDLAQMEEAVAAYMALVLALAKTA